jgi:hypothetical protein
VDLGDFDEMDAELASDTGGQHGHAVPGPLAVAHDDLTSIEIDIPHAQAQHLENAHSRPAEQPPDQRVLSAKLSQHAPDVARRKDDRQTGRPPGTLNTVEPWQLDAENLPVQEQDRALGLVLRGGRDVPLHGQARQERLDVDCAELRWMALVVKMDEASNPVHVGLLGADAVVLEAHALANARQKPWGIGVMHRAGLD